MPSKRKEQNHITSIQRGKTRESLSCGYYLQTLFMKEQQSKLSALDLLGFSLLADLDRSRTMLSWIKEMMIKDEHWVLGRSLRVGLFVLLRLSMADLGSNVGKAKLSALGQIWPILTWGRSCLNRFTDQAGSSYWPAPSRPAL